MKTRLLWEVQTLAANLDADQLAEIRATIVGLLGSDFADEILETWADELDES